jgi:hypothetical protein
LVTAFLRERLPSVTDNGERVARVRRAGHRRRSVA